ncbi:hypothetical protein FB005_10920 [Sinorhizobium medicae]|nr:hypothetical protein [Sinorhizobium meliloti]MDX0719720.1 hypothetical protein [Sinorhizobium medicae]MQV23328.1 hypothetical protein [Sinorhizobium meliloti]TWA22730.1 hypothetical protein FB006_10920 [Sinorhizobium medicae]TWA43028.1 hypothetical protein FB005_10920 [Sinorhizobium medicae]
MTSEICMMNRLAVVLAADSATTVSHWNGGQREERYFKGANKIFQLSEMEPVGLMIFDSADLLRVPWEVAIKSFRKRLGKKSFNTVDEYAKEFFAFLSDNHSLFPKEIQDDALATSVGGQAYRWVKTAIKDVEEAGVQAAITAKIEAEEQALGAVELFPDISEEDATKLFADLKEQLIKTATEWLELFEQPIPVDLERVVSAAFWYVVKHPSKSLSTTGLVFAGYGDHQIFPEMVEYQSCGVIGGKHVFTQKEHEVIDHTKPASLSGFAQTSMIDTFSLGLSDEAFSSMMVAANWELREFANNIIAASGAELEKIDNLPSLVQATMRKIRESVLEQARENHYVPLRNVIGFLPVDEMAGLAETLINLQSLKEKVTKPSETVGGPVDVAVITKHEGLVWIKRKHFFDSELNSRYKLRQAAQIQN